MVQWPHAEKSIQNILLEIKDQLLQLKLPSHPVEVDTPLIHFYSHSKSILFRLYLTPDGKLAVQVINYIFQIIILLNY